MAHVIWALRKYPVRTFLWLKIFKSARRGLNLWVQIKHLGSISSGQISKWTQRNFGLDQPTSLSEARGWRDRGKSTTSSKARDLMNLGPPLISSEARGLIGREAFWVLVNLKTSSEVRGWMGVCQLTILSEARGLMHVCQPIISSDLKSLMNLYQPSTWSEARDSLNLCQQTSEKLGEYLIIDDFASIESFRNISSVLLMLIFFVESKVEATFSMIVFA